MKWFLIMLNTVCLAAVILVTAMELPVFYRPFYQMEFDKYNIAVQVDMSESDLMAVTDHMLDYMSGKAPSLQISTVVGGQTREFFDQKELTHMADVKRLISDGLMVRNIALGGFIATLILLFALRYRPMRALTLVYQIFLGGLLVILGAVALLFIFNFGSSFDALHHMFFSNNLWQLDPSKDLLVDIVPQEFFQDLGIVVGILFAAISLLVMIVSAVIRLILGAKTPDGGPDESETDEYDEYADDEYDESDDGYDYSDSDDYPDSDEADEYSGSDEAGQYDETDGEDD